MPPSKRPRISTEKISDDVVSSSGPSTSDEPIFEHPEQEEVNASSSDDGADSESLATEDEIAQAQRNAKSHKTQKRKRRATSPSRFGSTLQALLKTDAPSNVPLSLKPSVAKRRTDEILEGKARKLLEGEKKEQEEKNHVEDVIGGWGAERERSLRKVAQRGGPSAVFIFL